jgi:hypothetical protein
MGIKKNIFEGIWVHPEHVDPDLPFHLRGKSVAIRFPDRALPTVGSAFCPYSHGLNRPFPDSPRTLAYPTDLRACFERDPVVSELGYVMVWWFMERMGWRGGSTVILLTRKGQKHLFRSHLVSGDYEEDDAIRGQSSVAGYGAPSVAGPPPCPSLPLLPLIRTLATATKILQISVDSGRVRCR